MIRRREMRNVAMLPALVLLMLLLCLPAAPAWGATYYVSTDGNDSNAGTSPKLAWKTISHAAKTAQAGDLVRIKGGDYGGEKVVIANSGTAEAPIRFEGYDGEVRLEGKVEKIKGKIKLGGQAVNIEGKSYIKISGITMLKYGVGIWVRKSHHITVARCTAGLCSWSAIPMIYSHRCQVKHCTVYNCGMCNITVIGGHDNTVADCRSYCHPRLIGIFPGVDTGTDYCYGATDAKRVHFIRCRGDGRLQSGHGLSFTRGGGGSGCSDCRVTDSEMYNCWELFGVRHGGHDIMFSNCYGESRNMATTEFKDMPEWCKWSYDSNSHGFYFRTGAHNITAKNCRVRGVRWGLDADNSRGRWEKRSGVTRNITFENCIATECIFGIQAAAPNTKVLNCLSTRNKYGILIDNVKGVSVKNSIICQNWAGIRGNEQTARITNCNIWGNEKNLYEKGREIYADGNLCYKDEKELYGKAITLGANCISKDPQFQTRNTKWGVIPGSFYDDWRLKETSPCKDMGPYAKDPKVSIGMR